MNHSKSNKAMYSRFYMLAILITSNVAKEVIPRKDNGISHNNPKDWTSEPFTSDILY